MLDFDTHRPKRSGKVVSGWAHAFIEVPRIKNENHKSATILTIIAQDL